MSKSPSLRRIQADIRELSLDPSDRYYAAPMENDMFEWHFTIRGADDTDFAGGIYHGRILLPPEYPFKPPHIIFLTPSGRFETHTKVCLSFSAYHPELWQPAWGIRLILEALISFLPTPADGAIGALDWTTKERQHLAKKSVNFCCPTCGPIKNIIPKLKTNGNGNKSSSRFAKEIQELQRMQEMNESKNANTNKESTSDSGSDEKDHGSDNAKQKENEAAADAQTQTKAEAGAHVQPGDDTKAEPQAESNGVDATEEAAKSASAPSTAMDPQASSESAASQSSSSRSSLATSHPSPSAPVETQPPANVTPATVTTAVQMQSLRNGTAPLATDRQPEGETATAPADGVAGGGPDADIDVDTAALDQSITDGPNVQGPHDPQWMMEPLLHLMIGLLAVICYMLFQKWNALYAELLHLRALNQQAL